MFQGTFVGNTDVAELALWAFTLFFIGLIIYLRREDRREGYPLEDEITGQMQSPGGPFTDAPTKYFKLAHGRGTVSAPTKGREPVDIAAKRTDPYRGAPYVPTGNPLTAGVGPGAYAERADHPDLDAHGHPRIVPLAMEPGFSIAAGDPDPRGMTVIAADGAVAGTVSEIWVDRAEHQVRYLEVATPSGVKALAPMPMAKIRKHAHQVVIDAINAADFAGVPQVKTPGQITFLEEEKVIGYFGAGYLYANSARQEPLL